MALLYGSFKHTDITVMDYLIRLARRCLILLPVLAAAGCASPAALPRAGGVLSPPLPLPVRVSTGMHLLNLAAVNERNETFEADVYLRFRWRDARLAFAPGKGERDARLYSEKDVDELLKRIWRPDIEFVNAAAPQLKNRSVSILADGTVDYSIGVTCTFRNRFSFGRFPFDRQTMEVRIESFIYGEDTLVFVPDAARSGFTGGDTCDDLSVVGVRVSERRVRLEGIKGAYSEFVGCITARRNCAFYLWRVFFPVMLIMTMSCTIYFIRISDFHDRVAISLSCLLACIATQFAISFSLPRISYLTIVDKAFLITYGCIAIGVGVSVVESALHGCGHRLQGRLNRFARWFVPLLYAALLAWSTLPHTW